MAFALVSLTLAAVIWLYFKSNPLNHSSKFMLRRFVNWFPLGMSYAFIYMARYNLQVVKNALGGAMSVESFGTIFGIGTAVYAVSLVFNGPFVDRIGGKKGIVISVMGAAAVNIAMGVVMYMYMNHQLTGNLTVPFAILYSLNMYFQSYGGVSIIKVKAYWFHVRERGLFGAIFGTLISLGVYFALDWGRAITQASVGAVQGAPTILQKLFGAVFATGQGGPDAYWLVFFIPAAILIFWGILDIWLIKDTPGEAGFDDFDTHDASSGDMQTDYSMGQLLKKVYTNPIILMVCAIELTTGVLRNGTLQWYGVFSHDSKMHGSEFFADNWGLILCITGIVGGFLAGYVSDHWFQSRRFPPVMWANALILILCVAMLPTLETSPIVIGICATIISFVSIGVHSLMSGTAAADFGGRKMTATASGITDAFVYLGTSVQSFAISGWLFPRVGWIGWPAFMIPFAIAAVWLARRMWHALPAATRRYLATVEQTEVVTSSGVHITATAVTLETE